ncbi:VanZ family protein [Ruania suaedae]|uniref:VanZ family protein n=1 Tax=Ruania suaedae TaxID=2897774 RepID=UPI001E3C860F|nr:VanZ family protein [Ruania suaedae]UFU02141.1 VanZ family protein [Ruania suaedae]
MPESPHSRREAPDPTPRQPASASTWVLRLAFAGAVGIHLVALYLPTTPGGPSGPPGADKAVHVLVFALVMLTGRLLRLPGVPLAAVLAVHAGVSELVQHLVLPGRTGDVADVVADLAGVGLGWYVATMITRHRLQR